MEYFDNALYRKYKDYSNDQMLIAMQNGNIEILNFIVYCKYKETLLSKIKSRLKDRSKIRNCFDEKSWLDDIYIHLSEKNRYGVVRFTTIKEGHSVIGWCIKAAYNHITSEAARLSSGNEDVQGGRGDDGGEFDKPKQMLILLENLDYINKRLKAQERYIILSDILVTLHKQGSSPTHFSDRISEVLGIKPAYVRAILKRTRDKIRAELGHNKLYQYGTKSENNVE